jgi:hypothetical protein
MPTLKYYLIKIFAFLKFIATITLAVSFVLMVLNITFFYGFIPSRIHTDKDLSNPFGLSIPLIWVIHLTVGFLAGMVLDKKRFFLAGSMGLLCAFLITGISILYFGWVKRISSIEILIILILGILPAIKLYDFLNKKYPLKVKQAESK